MPTEVIYRHRFTNKKVIDLCGNHHLIPCVMGNCVPMSVIWSAGCRDCERLSKPQVTYDPDDYQDLFEVKE